MFGAAPVPPPLEYDPTTGSLRSVARSSEPMTLLWVLVMAMALFGFADHLVWVGAGVLAAVTLAVEYLLVRRRRAAAALLTATGSRRA